MWIGDQIEVEERHECPARDAHRSAEHGPSDRRIPAARYGPALTRIERSDGRWWAHNDEYATEISFCPWCGEELEPEPGLSLTPRAIGKVVVYLVVGYFVLSTLAFILVLLFDSLFGS